MPDTTTTIKTLPSSAAAVNPNPPAPAANVASSPSDDASSPSSVQYESLTRLAWIGIPGRTWPEVWQLLLAYLPSDKKCRTAALTRKRRDYAEVRWCLGTCTTCEFSWAHVHYAALIFVRVVTLLPTFLPSPPTVGSLAESTVPLQDRTPSGQSILRQILVDVPRTSADVPLFHQVRA